MRARVPASPHLEARSVSTLQLASAHDLPACQILAHALALLVVYLRGGWRATSAKPANARRAA